MFYLLHGDDTSASRKFLTDTIGDLPFVILEGKTVTAPILEENLISTGLFESEKAVVVENLFSKNPKKKELGKFLESLQSSTMTIFWEDKKLPKTSILLKKATMREFSLPQYYFQFLDSLAPRQGKRIFTIYQDLLKSYAPEQLLFSLIKRIRQLVILSSGVADGELEKMNPWLVGKLQNQLRQWNKPALNSFYEELKETEIKLKTGNLPISLSKYLDILILRQLS